MSKLSSIFDLRVFAEIINVPPGVPVGANQLWGGIIPGAIKLLLVVVIILAFIFLLLGGISWITSGGNKEGLENARKKVTYAILGLIIALLSFFLIYTVGGMFGVNLKGP